jgi:hypothetical protein
VLDACQALIGEANAATAEQFAAERQFVAAAIGQKSELAEALPAAWLARSQCG